MQSATQHPVKKYCLFLISLILVFFMWIFWTPILDTSKLCLVDRHPMFLPVHPEKDTSRGDSDDFPRIFHQVFLGYSPPHPSWHNFTAGCRSVNKNFEYRLWNMTSVTNLLSEDYPWFLPTFHSYKYNVQRADAARYFIIHKHGGLYLDMDLRCTTPVEELLQKVSKANYENKNEIQCFFPWANFGTISQDLFLCRRNADFMYHMLSRLIPYNGWYGVPYLTVFLSTGPLLVYSAYRAYPNKTSIYVLSPKERAIYFERTMGRTWFTWDGWLINFIFNHILLNIQQHAPLLCVLFTVLLIIVLVVYLNRHFNLLAAVKRSTAFNNEKNGPV